MTGLSSPDLALRLPPGEGPYRLLPDPYDGEVAVAGRDGRVRLTPAHAKGEDAKMWATHGRALAMRVVGQLLSELGLEVAA